MLDITRVANVQAKPGLLNSVNHARGIDVGLFL